MLGGQLEAPAAEAGGVPPAETQVLSDEWKLSRWAYVTEPGTVRAGPDPYSEAVGRLRTRTQDGTPELVLALSEVSSADGAWVKVRFTSRPNGDPGWIPRRSLSAFQEVTTLLRITRARYRAVLYRDGRRVWSAPIGIGRPEAPTPRGRFYVRERLVPPQRGTIYGIFAFGTSATSPTLSDWPGGGVIGIHGTNQPRLIPGRISHGCIRIRNPRINKLRRLMPLGTPIVIE